MDLFMKQINENQFNELIAGGKPVVCDFFATWCGPCKMLAPVIDKCAEKYADKAVFVKVDIDENMELAARYGIMSIPLVGVFKGGEMVRKSLGYMSQSEADEFFAENL